MAKYKSVSQELTDEKYWDDYWTNESFPSYNLKNPYFGQMLILFQNIIMGYSKCTNNKVSLIDIGCGTGIMLRFFAENFDLDLAGIDFSDSIKVAGMLKKQLHFNYKLAKSDLNNDNLKNEIGTFDIVTSFGLIEHFTNPFEPLEKMVQLLNPGGCLVTIIPNFHGTYRILWKLYDKENYMYHIPIDYKELKCVYEELGLHDEIVLSLGGPSIPGMHNRNIWYKHFLYRCIIHINRILRNFHTPVIPKVINTRSNIGLSTNIGILGYKSE